MRVATLVLLLGCSGSKGGTDTWAGQGGEGERDGESALHDGIRGPSPWTA